MSPRPESAAYASPSQGHGFLTHVGFSLQPLASTTRRIDLTCVRFTHRCPPRIGHATWKDTLRVGHGRSALPLLSTMHTHQRPLRILSVALLCACSAHAGTALRFGPSSDYVTATTDFARRAQSAAPANASETRWLAPFEEEAPIIATSESYAGPTVHGGYEFISDNTHVLLTRQQIRERKGRPDSLALQAHSPDSWEGRSLALRGFFLFKQDAFESEYRAGPFTPDRLAASWNSYAAGDRRNITGRYVV